MSNAAGPASSGAAAGRAGRPGPSRAPTAQPATPRAPTRRRATAPRPEGGGARFRTVSSVSPCARTSCATRRSSPGVSTCSPTRSSPRRRRETWRSRPTRRTGLSRSSRDSRSRPSSAPARWPIRAARLGLDLDEADPDWTSLAHEATRVLLDVAQERARRMQGHYAAPSAAFRRAMAAEAGPVQPDPRSNAPGPAAARRASRDPRLRSKRTGVAGTAGRDRHR